jgi:hypothetical protein
MLRLKPLAWWVLPWGMLAGISGVPVINKGGLAEDWLIWSIVSCLVLYIVSARKSERKQDQATDPAASA